MSTLSAKPGTKVGLLLAYNLACILLFSALYYSLSPALFVSPENRRLSYLESFFYSTTTQSTIGLALIPTVHPLGKIILLTQHFAVLVSTYVLLSNV